MSRKHNWIKKKILKKHVKDPRQTKALKDLEELIGKRIPLRKESFWLANPDKVKFGARIKIIDKRENIEELGLEKWKLSTLPESISNFWALDCLFLEGNQLTTLPESLSKLQKLEYLDLSGNQLTSLPESIGNLTRLKRIHLSGNQLPTLPESIKDLKSLETLELTDNPLIYIAESLSKLEKLKYVILDSNQFAALMESSTKLEMLEYLDIPSDKWMPLPQEKDTRFVSVIRIPGKKISKNDIAPDQAKIKREILKVKRDVTPYQHKVLEKKKNFLKS